MIDYPLEFEVYHNQSSTKDTLSAIPLGVAFVDLSQMVYVDGVYNVSGYFHIVKRDRNVDGQAIPYVDPHRMSMESLGQLKLSVTSNVNFKRFVENNPLARTIARENSPMTQTRLMQHAPEVRRSQNAIRETFLSPQT